MLKTILHLVTNSDLGGAPRVVTELSNQATKDGYSVHVAAMPEGPMWDSLDPHIHQHQLRYIRRAINPIDDLRTFFEIKRLIKKINPDIIHAHSSKMGALVRLGLNKKNQKKCLYTIHGFDTILKAHRIFLPLEKRLSTHCAALVPVSSYDEHNIIAAGIKGQLCTIANGVSDRKDLQGENQDTVSFILNRNGNYARSFLSIARLARPKRFDLFIATATAFPQDVFYWIGNTQSQEELKTQYGSIPSNVFLLGTLTEAGNYCNYVDAVLLFSDYEGLPMSILEAFSCAKPVIASNVGGIQDAINTDTGILVKNTVESINSALETFDKNAMQKMGQSARTLYEQKFSAQSMSASYINLYKNIIQGE